MNRFDNHEKLMDVACQSNSTVLLLGDTGTGKTTLARKIHNQGSRRCGPFISVNLATVHEGTLESELFGHERGAFTGADRRREGRIEAANGGTLFLDEIGELSPRMQARLLEFLQSKTIVPVGSNRETVLDVRVIAATHKNLQRAVSRGEFREDLFHRLRVITLTLPSLRQRHEQFDDIVHSCLHDISRQQGKSILKLSPEVAETLENYDWPGNIRELRNVLEFAVLATSTTQIGLDDMPPWFLSDCASATCGGDERPVLGIAEVPLTLDFHGTLEFLEKEYLIRALSRNRGRITRTANQIGLNKTTLIRRIRFYGLVPQVM